MGGEGERRNYMVHTDRVLITLFEHVSIATCVFISIHTGQDVEELLQGMLPLFCVLMSLQQDLVLLPKSTGQKNRR